MNDGFRDERPRNHPASGRGAFDPEAHGHAGYDADAYGQVSHEADRHGGHDQGLDEAAHPSAYADMPGILRKTRRRRRLTPRRMVFNFCKFAAGIFVLAVIGAGILALRLQEGPIAIDGLGQKIASALQDRFGAGFSFDLGETSMLQRGFGPTLAIDKLVVSGPDRQVILSAPKAEVSVDPFALVFGKVSPKRLEVMDVTLRLVLLKNGALAIAAGDGTKPFLEIGARSEPAPPDPAPSEGQLPAPRHRAIVMRQAAAAIRQFLDILTDPHGTIAAVDRLGITRGRLVIDDQMTNEEVVYSDLDLAFDKAHGVTNLTLSATGRSGRWTVSAMASGVPGAERRFELKAESLSIDEAQLIAGTRSLGFETDMPIALAADVGLSPDNTLSEAAGSFKLGPGYLRLDDPDQEPILLKEVSAAFHWNGTDRRVEVDPLSYAETSGSHFAGSGTIKPPHDEGEPWRIDMAMKAPGVFAPDRSGQHPVSIDSGTLAGRLFPDQKTFKIDRFAIEGKEGGIALAGAVDWVKGPHVAFGASIAPTSVPFAQRVWPTFMAASVRAWVVNHFEGGLLTKGTIRVDYDQNALKRMRADRAPPDKSVSLDFELSNGRLRYLDGVPPMDAVNGVGHITGRTSRFTVTSGSIDASGRKVLVSDGAFFVPDTNQHPTPATFNVHLKGDVEAITDILSRDALKPYASLPLDASTLHGEIEGDLTKTIVLGTHLGINGQQPDESLRVEAKVSDFVAERLVGQENLENASLRISIDEMRMKATGQGRIFGGPATFDIERVASGAPNAKIAITLDEAARAKLGFAAIPGFAGPITAHVDASLGDPSQTKAQVEIDLAKASIAAAYVGLVKPAGRPGKVSFVITPRNDRISLEQLVIDVASLQGRGVVELGANNAFQSAHLTSLKVSPGDDMRVDVVKADDVVKLTVRGSTIDARPFLKALTSTPSNDSTAMARSAKAEKKEIDNFRGFDIDLKTGILTGFNKEVMNAVDLKLSKRGPQYRQFSVHGRFGGDGVSGTMGANQRLKVQAADAGALVSFIDLYKHMEGGDLIATMQVGDDSLTGNLEIHDFVLRDEPAIRSLVARTDTVVQPGQTPGASRRINAGAVDFKRLKVTFEREGSRLALHDATMSGDEIGLSVDGWLDYVHNRVEMNGTFVPAYAFNNMFAQIPLFGVFLGNKSNEGLLAVTFTISGSASTPTLSYNPLTLITPGFLRNLFGVLDAGGAAQGAGGTQPAEPFR